MEAQQPDEFLTIKEAAHLLRISPVTISRWLKQGRLRAYHLGPRSIRIRRDDLDELLVESGPQNIWRGDESKDVVLRPLNDAEVARLREALERAATVRARILESRGGKPLPSSAELIAQAREERSVES